MKLKKLVFSIILIVVLLVGSLQTLAFGDIADGTPLDMTAKGAVLLDVNTETILYKRNSTQQCRPASLTKMMTLLVAYEQLEDRLDEEVVCTKEMIDVPDGSSTADLVAGDKVKIIDLFYMMMLDSGNDAAKALAFICAGGEADFAVLMNEKAEELGMNDTRYKNAHGFEAEGHYTTPLDLARLSLELCKNEKLVEIFSTVHYKAQIVRSGAEGGAVTVRYTNTNLLINPSSAEYLDGTKGIKTGYTSLAGNCLTSYWEKDGRKLVAVVVGCEGYGSRDSDMCTLLKYGINSFDSFDLSEVFGSQTYIVDVASSSSGDEANGQLELYLEKGEAKNIVVSKSEGSRIRALQKNTVSVRYPVVEAPVTAGENVGKIEFIYKGEVIYSANALAARSIDKQIQSPADLVPLDIKGKIRISFAFLKSPFFYVPIIAVVVIFALVVFVNKHKKEKRRRLRRRQQNAVLRASAQQRGTRPGNRF